MPAKLQSPGHRVIVLPWLKRPMQRFVLPNWTAITIGARIFAWRALDEFELAHEVAHVEQWRRHGFGFIRRYFAASSAARKAGGDRYSDNAFEREAREAEDRLRRDHERGGGGQAETAA